MRLMVRARARVGVMGRITVAARARDLSGVRVRARIGN